MLKMIYSVIALLLFLQSPASAWDVLVVQHYRTRPYEEALRGFRSACRANIRELVISESEGGDAIAEVRARKPDLVVAIGMEALRKLKKIREIPIVYMMVLSPGLILNGEDNITGINMNVSPEKQLSILHGIFPGAKKIGLIYCSGTAARTLDRASRAAAKRGMSLIVLKADGPKDFPVLLRSLKGDVDVYWMLPDSVLTSLDIVEDLFLFSIRRNMPVFTFSDKYLKMGALASLQVDIFKMGKRAGEAAKRILSGTPVAGIPEMEADDSILTVNYKTAAKMGIHMSGIP